MICNVSRLRARGIRVSAKMNEATTGDLRINEMTQSAFGRSVRMAQLMHPSRPNAVPQLLPPLFDVQLLQLEKEQLVLAGIERECIDGQFVDYAQTWLVDRQK